MKEGSHSRKLLLCVRQIQQNKSKGEISIGKDADIVIYDPAKEFTITNEKMHSDVDHTIWEGVKLHGYPVQTYSRGKLVYDEGEFVGERGWGRLIKCSR